MMATSFECIMGNIENLYNYIFDNILNNIHKNINNIKSDIVLTKNYGILYLERK